MVLLSHPTMTGRHVERVSVEPTSLAKILGRPSKGAAETKGATKRGATKRGALPLGGRIVLLSLALCDASGCRPRLIAAQDRRRFHKQLSSNATREKAAANRQLC